MELKYQAGIWYLYSSMAILKHKQHTVNEICDVALIRRTSGLITAFPYLNNVPQNYPACLHREMLGI
jgi:hypothetical protein